MLRIAHRATRLSALAITLSVSTALAPAVIAPRAQAQSAVGHPEWPGKGDIFVGTCYQPVDRSPEQIRQDIAVMTIGRLAGDAVTNRVGDRAVLFWGGILAVVGFAVLLLSPGIAIALAGFILIGLGASNIVPVLFRKAGSQRVMPSALAIGAITTTGYAGILVGPAGIGLVAEAIGLKTAFWMLAALMCLVPATANIIAAGRKSPATT